MKLIMLVGLPGSGKTEFGKSLGFPFLDDLSQNGRIEALIEAVGERHSTLIISDFALIFPHTCVLAKSVIRESLESLDPEPEFEWVYWENNPEQCWRNIEFRKDGRMISRGTLFEMSKWYVYPDARVLQDPTIFRQVFRPSNSKEMMQ